MKKITAVSLILLCSITLIFAQAMGENLSSIAEGMTVETKEETHTFTVDVLTAAADKEAVAEGSSVDMEGHGYFKVSGSVLKRWKEDKGVTSVEVGKALSGSIDFTVTGTADVVLTVSSNGGSNSSAVGIIDQNGNLIENAEKITVVEGTSKTVLTYNGLQAGTYKVVSPAHSEFKRGARVYTVVANETVTVEPAPEADSYEWDFTYFGVSVGKDRNFLVSSGEGIKDPVSLSSATFNEDGSIKKKGGKFVSDAPADGASYYYTVIDPTTTNFYLQADVTVDQINPTLDGQEGFALMARDAIGDFGAGGSWMANLVSVTCAKLPSPNTSATIGVRAYTGIYTSEASDQNQVASTLLGWYKNEEGNPIKVEVGKTYRVSLEKTDYAYIATQYDIDTNKVIGSYTYYIPAKDNEAVSVKSYSELNDPLTFQEANAAYIALVVARGLNATFSNIKFTTSSWKAENWKPQPTTYVDLTASVISSETTAGGEYNLVFRTNADGLADVYCADRLVAEAVPVENGVQCRVSFEMPEEKADVNVKFTPDPEFKFSAYEKLSSYDTVTFGMTVTQRSLGKDSLIYVAVNGQEKNNGTSFEDATDLLTAFKYVAPGQGIILEAGVYDLSGVGITVSRGRDGSFENPIVVTTKDDGFATFDFGGTGSGMKLWGDWWYLSNINITRTADGKHGMQLAGSNCYLYRVNFYNNGTSGLTVSGDSKDTIEFWPAFNTVESCTSMNNADKALEDADGFCAKLTTGEGNVFDKCISAYNADDGWDLFAKVASGSIGQVTIKNSLTYKNGYIMVKEGSTTKSFEFADVVCDENGTLTFTNGVEMEAGNGNGFKMGGSNLAGGHTLINSIAYENKTKGIDSNSCPDIKAFNCTSYNNGSYNIAMYTGNKSATTDFSANGVISFRSGDYKNQPETLTLQGQNNSAVYGISNYWWDTEKKVSENTEGTAVDESWFVSLDTSVAPERNADGTINMHGLLLLNEEARSKYAAGARGFAWGQKEATVWVVGDSTVSPFNDKYYLPREGYGEEISSYFNATTYNLAHSGASSKDYTTMADYDVLMNGSTSVPALGDADTEKFLIIGFGHNDEKTEVARYTNPNGDYKTEGSFANSLYVNYIQPALDRGVVPVVCTPIARLTTDNTAESYESASGHKTEDTVIGDNVFEGGDYAQAIRKMVDDLRAEGIYVEMIDLTKATIAENIALGEGAQYLHSFTGAKYDKDGTTLIATGLDKTHTNMYGAKLNAYLISVLSEETAPLLYQYSSHKDKPTYDMFFEASVNADYEVPTYKTPTEEQMNSVSWPVFTSADGTIWHGTVFGDVGGKDKISADNFSAVIDGEKITLSVANNRGKISSGSDGLMFYYVKLPVGKNFTISAKAKIEKFTANNQVSFGLMVRDELYIDEYVSATMGDYVAAGSRNQGAIVNFGRKSSALVGSAPQAAISLEPGSEVELKIVSSNDGYTLTYGGETVSAGFDYALTGIDSDYVYAGFYVVRNCSVTFSDISLVINE